MKTSTKFWGIAILLLMAAPVWSSAQGIEELIKEDRRIAANQYNAYPDEFREETDAPKGFKPFYISHFGRHGSRFHSSMSYLKNGLEGLETTYEAGLLSDEGVVLYDEFKRIVEAHEGMNGHLTALGAAEHRGIAQRMYMKYEDVFRDGGTIEAVSSFVPRCIMSMTNFCTQLLNMNPDLSISYRTGERYFHQYINKEARRKDIYADTEAKENSLRYSGFCSYDTLFSRIFNDPDKAESLLEDPQAFVKSVYLAGAITGCVLMELGEIDIFQYFTDRELLSQSILRNNKFYGEFGGSKEWGDITTPCADALIKDIVTRADAAIEAARSGNSCRRAPGNGNGNAADLRFGHDTGIIPLLALMGIEGFEQRPMSEAHLTWAAGRMIPMGTNLQLIFYKNRRGDILVKLLYNESETGIPALTPLSGPYYRWTDLRTHLNSRY